MQSTRGFDAERCRDVSQDHLVVVALLELLEDGKQPSFENLVAEAFRSFPERFQLEGYPEWPNANVINKAWVRCRTDKKWISGSTSQGFKLTPLGEHEAHKTLSLLRRQRRAEPVRERKGSRQTISARVVLRVENSSAYRKFKAGDSSSISEYDFCELLYSTLESTPETIEKNFSIVNQQVESYGRPDLAAFLDELRNRFPSKFAGKRSRGGLMPQKKEE